MNEFSMFDPECYACEHHFHEHDQAFVCTNCLKRNGAHS